MYHPAFWLPMDIFGRCNGGGGGSTVSGSGAGSVRGSSNESSCGTASAPSESGGTSDRMQLTGASAPGAAASPESGVSPLTDAYTKMTSDILAERTLGDFVSEHPGELVRTGIREKRSVYCGFLRVYGNLYHTPYLYTCIFIELNFSAQESFSIYQTRWMIFFFLKSETYTVSYFVYSSFSI